jgi:serine/threonine protein kinase
MYYYLTLLKGNVLVDNSQRAVLCDFGLLQILLDEGSNGMTTSAAHSGSERYLALELVNGDELVYPTTASDVYAAGCIGLEVLFTVSGRF